MPEAKKISELPVLSSVQPNDILPIVDEALTQTSKCTASQIAALGGGPPGVNMVQTVHLQDGAVTASKVGFTGPDKIITRTASGAGGGVEVACTSYARGLLAAADGPTARSYLNALQSTADPEFIGQVRFADGTSLLPSITNTGNLKTGIFFPVDNSIGFTMDGFERFRISEDGAQYSNYPGTAISQELRAQFTCRAWVHFNAAGTGAYTITNQHTIAQRYRGAWGSLADTADTRAKIIALETATTGWEASFPALVNTGTEGRTNYTTCGDNIHWDWSPTANGGLGGWISRAACSYSWIARVTLTPTAPFTGREIFGSGGIGSVNRTALGEYTITFARPMPDQYYAVVGSCSAPNMAVPGVVRILLPQTTQFQVTTTNINGTNIDPGWISLAVFR